MTSPKERVGIAVAESTWLKNYLGSLTPAQWRLYSACNRWQARDVVAHLTEVADAYIQRIHESLLTDMSTFSYEDAPGFVTATSHAEGNAQQAISRREREDDDVMSAFVRSNDELIRLMTTFEQADWDLPHYYASLGTIPMRYRPDLWIAELAVHGWDIRSRLEPEAHLSDDSLPVLMDVVPGQMTIFFFKPRPELTSPIRFRWELTGPGAKNSDLVIEADRATWSAHVEEEPDVTFVCDVETMALVGYGRLSCEQAAAEGRLIIQGNMAFASEFERSFAWS